METTNYNKLTYKKLISATLCLFAFFTVISCKKGEWYDAKYDQSLAVPSTLKDMQALMDNGLAMNTFTPGLGEVASDGHSISNQNLLQGKSERNAYSWSYELSFPISLDWSNGETGGSYRRVYYANLTLDGMFNIKPKGGDEQEQWNNIKGQALFHRAHAFYELAQVFAPPYEAGTAGNKLGIPLRLESDINIPSKRSTLQQTYDQIINDLVLAKDLLPESPAYRTRPSKQSVYALLARCYLSMEIYEQAGAYANLTLNSYATLMNYSSLNTSTTANPFKGYNPEIIFYTKMTNYLSIQFANSLIDRILYDSYSNNDLRKKAFFNLNTGTNLVRYKGTYSGSDSGFPNCFSGLATDEVYLIRAECYARANKVTEAMNDLNTLLKTRWDPGATNPANPYVNITATDKDDALRKVLEERKKELILRGLRWSDLRRLNRDARFAVTLMRIVDGKTYTIEPNSYKYTFPIPEEVIQKTGMQQNEDW